MANDHYAICEATKHYCYLGEFYEGDVGSERDIKARMAAQHHSDDRLNNGTGVYYMLRLLAFMRRRQPHAVRVVHEEAFYDLDYPNRRTTWTEDELN